MKLRNTALLFAALLFVGASDAFAQEQDSDNITASVDVVTAITVNGNHPLQFGTLSQGAGEVTLNPQTGDTDNGTGTTSAGRFLVEGAPGEEFEVNWTSTELTDVDDNNGSPIAFNPSVSGNAAYDQPNSTTIDGSNNTDQVLSNGTHHYWIGGSIDVPNGQASSTYEGTFTLTATYTSL